MSDSNDFSTIDTNAVASLFLHKVQVAMSREEHTLELLYQEEQALISHAIKKRQCDFAAGRICAKNALAKLGVDKFPVLMDAKGAPLWPKGVAGSISHAKGCCAAVVAQVQVTESLGLDIEEVHRIDESIWDYAFCPQEIDWLAKHSAESQKWASVIFAAKEAFYKAQYPLTHSWLGFKDVMLTIDQNSGAFTVQLLVYLGKWPKGSSFLGKYAFFDEYVAAGVWIGAS